MSGYIVRRIGQSLVVIILLSIITFLLVHMLPGGAARAILGLRASPSAIKAFDIENGYNKPLPVQYIDYMGRVLRGNFGFSYKFNEPVSTLLASDLPKSAYLAGVALILTVLIAIPLGIYQAVRRDKADDYALTALSFIGYSMPAFWLGIILIAVFAVYARLLPSEGPQAGNVMGAITDPKAMILPVLTLTILGVALFSRYMRSSAIETLAQDYIRTARAKGVTQRRLLFVHLLRNAVLPIVTLIGLSLPFLLTGNLVIESVFNYPGAGLLYWDAATSRDYPTLLALTLVVGVVTVLGNLIADIGLSVIDRRVRFS